MDYVVAPFEADAQLTYLESQGLLNGVITGDSDLLAFGCKEVILFYVIVNFYTNEKFTNKKMEKLMRKLNLFSFLNFTSRQPQVLCLYTSSHLEFNYFEYIHSIAFHFYGFEMV